MKIVFMGTPQFAVASLEAIVENGYEIAAVVTVPDKPAGRGQQLHFSDVKKYALAHQLPLLQPEKLKDPAFLSQLQAFDADLFVVVAFRMLPEVVFSMPRYGTFNVHASLLPDYRGAAPIHHAVMNGEKFTGVTTFFLNKEIDKGDIIDSVKLAIGPSETTGALHDRLMEAGAQLAVKTIQAIEEGQVHTHAQPAACTMLKPAPKIFTNDTYIDWHQPALLIFNKIRGLSPFPCARTNIKTKEEKTLILKCYAASLTEEKSTLPPGTLSIENNSIITVSTLDTQIILNNLQIEGKKRMNSEEFIKGFRQEYYILSLF